MKIIYFLFLLGLICSIKSETINDVIDELAKMIPDLKKDLYAQPATQHQVVQVIVGKGFTSFEQSGSVQKIIGVAEQFIDPFLANMQAQMKLPPNEQQRLTDTIQKILWEDSEEWINFDVVFREAGSGQTKYVCLLGKHSWETQTTDWLIADIKATFTFAPDIYVLRSCKKRFLRGKKCHNDYIQRPHAVTEEEIIALNSFMQIVAFERFQELKGYNSNSITGFSLDDVFSHPENEGASIWESAAGVISKGCELWTGFVNAFKSSKSTQIVGQLEGKGFSYYRQSASIQKVAGLDPSYLDTFLSHLLVRIKVPQARQEELKFVLMDCIFMEGTDWKIYDNVFDKDTKGTAKMVQLMMNRDENTGKTNWLIADLEGEFKLAPDLLYVQTSKSIAGGIWSSSKVEIKTVPKAMTQADLEAFYAFFWIIAQKEIGEKVGLQLNYPKLNDIELVDNGSIWESASGVISKGCELWTGFVNAFKSSKSTQIVGQLEGKGFSYYRQSASIQKIGGLDPSYLDTFLSHLLVRIKVPEHRVEEVKYVIMDCIFMEGTDWKIYDNVFDKDTKGTAKMVQLMMNRDENTGKTNWLIADLEGEFKLAPDLLYIQTSKSIAGGIWSSSKVEIKDVPRSMTQDDLDAFYAFFWIIAQKEIGEKVGLQLTYPKL